MGRRVVGLPNDWRVSPLGKAIDSWLEFWCFHGLNCGPHRLDGEEDLVRIPILGETLVQDGMPVGAVLVVPTE